jgi:hypothetical protein
MLDAFAAAEARAKTTYKRFGTKIIPRKEHRRPGPAFVPSELTGNLPTGFGRDYVSR